jgi:hypothetical protein
MASPVYGDHHCSGGLPVVVVVYVFVVVNVVFRDGEAHLCGGVGKFLII